jgi:hypothetical protein
MSTVAQDPHGVPVVGEAYYEAHKAARRQKYAQFFRPETAWARHAETLGRLDRDGVAVVNGALDRAQVETLSAFWQGCLRDGRHVRGKYVAAGLASARRLTDDEIARGPVHCRDLTNHLDLVDPLVTCPAILDIALSDWLLDLAAAYYDSFPAFTYVKLRTSFANRLPELDTQLFHADGNSRRMLKAFVYLNDVTEEGGPFCYVKGSHRTRFPGWDAANRWTLDDMIRHYGADAVWPVTASMGDLVLADTTGFHRGNKPTRHDRAIIILNYLLHEEYGGGGDTTGVTERTYRALTDKQRAAIDMLPVEA